MKPVQHSHLSVLVIAALVVTLCLVASPAGAGPIPTQINYQGLLTDKETGQPLSGTVYLEFQIVLFPSGDGDQLPLWSEGVRAVTLHNGLFDIKLGSITPLLPSVFDNDQIYLRVLFSETEDGPFAALEPNQRIVSVAYALRAERAVTADDADALDGQPASAFALTSGVFSKADLSDPGALNATGNPVDWTKLKGVPAGLADGADNDTLGGLSCADGQVAQWNGTAWTCASASGGTDHGALTGLADDDHTQYFHLGQNETVTGVPAFNGGTSGSSPPFSVDSTNPVYNLNADLLDGQHGSHYQTRVSGACAVGSTVRSVNADGTVVCEAHDARPLYTRTLLDSGGMAGQYTAIAIGVDGLALISYTESTTRLKVAHCADVACTSATVTMLDSSVADVGKYTSLTIGADGLGLISYYDDTNDDLKVAHCANVACTSATLTTLDSSGSVGRYTSVTIGIDGLGLISYHSDSGLKVAHCANVTCTSASLSTLDSTSGGAGRDTSITIGADGLGLISYNEFALGDLKVAHCSDVACSSATVTTLDSTGTVGYDTSVTLGADGLGLISYWDYSNSELKVAHCSNPACTSATLTMVDSDGTVGQDSSVTIGADGLGLISYHEDHHWTGGGYYWDTHDVKVAHCANVACTSATIARLDSTEDDGYYTSVTIGPDGLGLISYYDYTNGDLKVAHCSNSFCTPYFRRR